MLRLRSLSSIKVLGIFIILYNNICYFYFIGNQQRRWGGGMIKKNIRAEENAGMREISYRTWVRLI